MGRALSRIPISLWVGRKTGSSRIFRRHGRGSRAGCLETIAEHHSNGEGLYFGPGEMKSGDKVGT